MTLFKETSVVEFFQFSQMSVYEKYETVVGLEVHVQLGTKSKAFCSDDTSFGAAPNTHISAISLGHPGTLPRMNKQQINYAVRLGLALGCKINVRNTFDRKNYFYADLPKGYQITQDANPICIGGEMEIEVEGVKRKIRLHHIHMEEDAGKSIHDLDPQHSFIDLNRAGVPLLEIVTEPDFRSPDEVATFMNAMRQLVRYLEVSDGNMEEGSLRCDCNVSVRLKGTEPYGKRCEIKNMNSMRYAKQAIKYEFKRQVDLIENGGQVQQQTLNFDPVSGTTSPLREKEYAHDYRYFPEPDLPPVVLSESYIESIKVAMPPLPWVLKKQLEKEYQLTSYQANILTEEKEKGLYFLGLTQSTKDYKAAANLLINKLFPLLEEKQLAITDCPIPQTALSDFLQLIHDGKVSSSVAYQKLFPALFDNTRVPVAQLAEQLQLIQNSDEDFLKEIITQAIAKHPDKVKAYQKGKKNLLGLFMGEVMRNSKGKADPKLTNQLLMKMLLENNNEQ